MLSQDYGWLSVDDNLKASSRATIIASTECLFGWMMNKFTTSNIEVSAMDTLCVKYAYDKESYVYWMDIRYVVKNLPLGLI
jgi:hypothetical protein